MKLTTEQVAFLDGLLEDFSEFPDGAWQQACEDAIRDSKKFRWADPYDVWIAWVEARNHD